LNNYREAQQAEVNNAIAAGKTAIDNAADVAGVESALASAKATIDGIKTDAQLTAEELAAAKETAKTALDGYVALSNYREAQQAEVTNAIAAGKTAIDNAADTASVESALGSAKATIDGIKTNSQLTAEELSAAKETAKTALDGYVTLNNYREAQQAEVTNAISAGKTAIDNAADTASVESALASAKATIDGIKTDAQLTAEEAGQQPNDSTDGTNSGDTSDNSTVDNSSVDNSTVDNSTSDNSTVDNSTSDNSTSDKTSDNASEDNNSTSVKSEESNKQVGTKNSQSGCSSTAFGCSALMVLLVLAAALTLGKKREN
jgi:hypothetical protein